jgi:hypothetical protein
MKGISSGKLECDEITIETRNGNCVMIAVSECGSDILPELPERVFDGVQAPWRRYGSRSRIGECH